VSLDVQMCKLSIYNELNKHSLHLVAYRINKLVLWKT